LNDIAIKINNLSKTFKIDKPRGFLSVIKSKLQSKKSKNFLVLDNISFTVKKGEILSVIGLNGSGKTTLLRMIAGVYKPDSGSVQIDGKMSQLMQLGTGFQPELDAEDNIILNGMLLGISKSKMIESVPRIIQYAELEKFSHLNLKYYSSGMRSRLAFSIAMEIDPDILLVDEILSVGDKNFQNKSYEKFLSYKQNNKTILHATHNLSKLTKFSDRVLLLNKGKMVTIGSPAEVIEKYQQITNKGDKKSSEK